MQAEKKIKELKIELSETIKDFDQQLLRLDNEHKVKFNELEEEFLLLVTLKRDFEQFEEKKVKYEEEILGLKNDVKE